MHRLRRHPEAPLRGIEGSERHGVASLPELSLTVAAVNYVPDEVTWVMRSEHSVEGGSRPWKRGMMLRTRDKFIHSDALANRSYTWARNG